MKNIFSIAIVFLGIIGAYFIVQQTKPTIPSVATNKPAINQKNNSVTGISLNSLFSQGAIQPNGSQSEPQNLTAIFAAQIEKSIVENNPNGAETIEGEKWLNSVNPDQLAADAIAEAVTSFNPDDLIPNIANSDIKVTSDNSKESLKNYFSALNGILSSETTRMPTNPNLEANFTNVVKQAAAAYQIIFSEIKNLVVPSSLFAIHKEELTLLGARINILKIMQNYQTDPVKTILALKEANNLDLELLALQQEMKNFINKNEL
ncbi:MAG: hypothetical protein PHP03_02130 [Candidatus Pacebacteria bacterium]|nr:hypothetical protein [Candidatus Paceibacterota bacterium]